MNNNDYSGKLYVFSGPSGTGKSSIVKPILDSREDCTFSVSATTRDKREGEEHGVNYYFVDRKTFTEMIDRNEFLEYAEYVNNLYGTPKKPVLEQLNNGKNVILDIEVQGADQIKKQYPEAVLIFIVPPSLEELERRLINRGTDSSERIAQRMDQAKREFSKINNYDYIVVNDVLEKAIKDADSIISSQDYRYSRRNNEIMEVYKS